MRDEDRKVIAAERPVGTLLWVWSFHSTASHEGLLIPAHSRGRGWRVVASSDEARFGGHQRVAMDVLYGDQPVLYVPNRCCIVLERQADGLSH